MLSNIKHPAEPYDELIRCFDNEGNEIQAHSRGEIHQKPLRWWHAVTGVIVVNTRGQILCSKRSEQLSQCPGRWQANFGGHVNAGKTFEQNAVEELLAESGIAAKENEMHFLEVKNNEEFKHICKFYACMFKGKIEDLHFSDGEITEVKWMNMQEAWREKLLHPDQWAGGCPPDRQGQIKQWLQSLNM